MSMSKYNNIAHIKEQFPVLKQTIHGNRLVYLDNAASTQRPIQVIESMTDYARNSHSNVHRGIHFLSEKATYLYEKSRERVAEFIGAKSDEIVFTRNATEAINLVARTWAEQNLSEGDIVLLSELEHHSNIVPWQLLSERKKIRLRFLPFNDIGKIDVSVLSDIWDESIKLVSVSLMSNVFGTIQPVEEIISYAHARGAIVMLDAAQAAAHMPLSVKALNCDFMAVSAHKIYGPTGIGFLWAKRDILEDMPPFLGGGDMILSVDLYSSSWNDIPHKFEAGTPNIEGAAGFAEAVSFISSLGFDTIIKHERVLTDYAIERLEDIEGLTVYGSKDSSHRGVISFYVDNIHPHDVAQILDSRGVAVRAGHHCAQPIMKRLSVPATVRASFAIYNTVEDIDVLVSAIKYAKEFF
ncbi:cysteine desulfurase [Spirochaetia bacterium 38H-sp]|uniref:Cysteine desulfurase n=1 Tax=Rarispira pelagica TaxID=3141764 RepID=A0ABU9UDL5_9SPIR